MRTLQIIRYLSLCRVQAYVCCSSISESWYEPSWGVKCGTNLIWLIAKGYAQIVSDVSVDVLDVSDVLLTGLSSLAIVEGDI